MKIIVPMAGVGSRLKPHTHTVPKPLIEVAGKPILEYVIEDILKLNPDEIVFVVGYKRESIKDYIKKFHPDLNCKFVIQKTRDGDGSAIRLGLEEIDEDDETFVIFGADTLVDFDIKKAISLNKDSDAVIFGMEVDEPQHYGVMDITENNEVYAVEEKVEKPKSNLAIIGAYYFKSSLILKKLLNEFHDKGETIKGEYKLVQAIESYIKMKDTSIKSYSVKKWFDCGRVEVLLEANRYFLEKHSKGTTSIRGSSIIMPPSYVSSTAVIENSVIGPYASIGDETIIKDTIIKNSIVNYKSKISHLILHNSLIGKEVILHGKPSKINIGEKSEIFLD